LNILKAVKLLYLADRESVSRHGFPIQDEPHYSLPNGPVNSHTYEFMKGEVHPDLAAAWNDYLTDRSNHEIGLRDPDIDPDDLDELSEADLSVLDAVWDRFGHMDQWELVEWTHDVHNVPEWEDPKGSSALIPLRRMMDALGVQNAADQEQIVQESRRASAFLKAI
jgi:uncharacterized phage-associated protein